MPIMTFDLEDGKPPVSFSINNDGAERFMAFMAECSAAQKAARAASQPSAQVRDAVLPINKLTRWTFDGGMSASIKSDGQWVYFDDLERLAAARLPAQGTVREEAQPDALERLEQIKLAAADHGYVLALAGLTTLTECAKYGWHAGEVQAIYERTKEVFESKRAALAAPDQQPTDSAAQSGDEGVA